MYARGNTWLEHGPAGLGAFDASGRRVVVLPSLYRFSRVIEARRGMGAIPQLSQEHCDSGWSLLNPVAWLGGCAARDAANVYEAIQYGSIPRPQSLPSPPVPGVPTVQNRPAVDPGNAGVSPADWAAWTQAQRDAIQAAQDSGAWNPEGNLPLNAIDLANFWDRYGTAAILVGVAAVGYVAWRVGTR